MRPLRLLWGCYHRVARFEEVNSLLRAGVEVVPVFGTHDCLPNAQDPPEADDNLYPRWRENCTIPRDVVDRIRTGVYAAEPSQFPHSLREEINRWFDVILVASFTRVAVDILTWFKGHVILRAYGHYPYSGILSPGTFRGENTLFRLAACDRFIFCPAMPYLALHEDPRITRNERYVPAGVSIERLPERWLGRESDPIAREVISLIDRYRKGDYRRFADIMGDVPFEIMGINPPGGASGSDPRIIGTLDDAQHCRMIASSRVFPYLGLDSKLHLHYHAIEALLMGVPVLFVSNGSIAHMARYHGFSEDELRSAGMCKDAAELGIAARRTIESVDEAIAISQNQSGLRSLFGREDMDRRFVEVADYLRYRAWYTRTYGRADSEVSLTCAARSILLCKGRALNERARRAVPAKVRAVIKKARGVMRCRRRPP